MDLVYNNFLDWSKVGIILDKLI